MTPAQLIARPLLCAVFLLAASVGHAEKADRNKPVNLEADRVTVDEIGKVHVFDGNVTLSQGTLIIRSDKLVVKQDAEGFQNGIATANSGKLARFRVKRDGKDEYIEGEGERIEYDAKTEITKFFNRAYVKSGLDEVRGQYIVFDGPNENYSVTSGPAGTVVPGRENRVHAVIQPKNKPAPEEATSGQPVRLQIAPSMSNPR
ncbi:MAG: lipopolysaccharide transport periplasmic protein LptA [Betaproteobacteria bacterium]|jgi:lipopolysaccharide export system protein LptA|nr:lipopolysaccharide transport periplasmic protein LptA [Betaproteobacteria bacterium]